MRLSLLLLSLIFPFVAPAQEVSSCWIQDAASPSNGVAALLCDNEKILLSDGSTSNFRPVQLPVTGKLRAIEFSPKGRGFIVGDSGVLLESNDGGNSWRQIELPIKETLTAIHFVGDLGWLAGYSGAILHTRDGGQTWTPQESGASISFEDIFFIDPEHGWAVGWGGAMIRTTDGGRTWIPMKATGALWSLNSVFFRDRQNGWATGMFGLILHTKDGGETWEKLESPVNASIRSVYFDSTGRGWMTAENHILSSTDNGKTWTSAWTRKLVFLQKLAPMGDSILAVGPFTAMLGHAGAWKQLPVFPKLPSSMTS